MLKQIENAKQLVEAAEHRARRSRLKGVQLSFGEHTPVAYRVKTHNGTAVLCDGHLDLLRERESATLTGETFDIRLCDECLSKEEV